MLANKLLQEYNVNENLLMLCCKNLVHAWTAGRGASNGNLRMKITPHSPRHFSRKLGLAKT